MEAQDCKGCPSVSFDPVVMHGEPVFNGTRMPVMDAVESYYAYRDQEGMSDENAVINSFRTVPGPDALRTVL